MREPATRSELLERIRSTRTELDTSVRELSAQALDQPGAAGHWSAKDILLHVSWWEHRTIEKLNGLPTAHDQLGGPDNDRLLTAINEQTYAEQRGTSAQESLATFRASLDDLVAALEQADETHVLANLEFIAENTYRHYPEHTDQIANWATQHR